MTIPTSRCMGICLFVDRDPGSYFDNKFEKHGKQKISVRDIKWWSWKFMTNTNMTRLIIKFQLNVHQQIIETVKSKYKKWATLGHSTYDTARATFRFWPMPVVDLNWNWGFPCLEKSKISNQQSVKMKTDQISGTNEIWLNNENNAKVTNLEVLHTQRHHGELIQRYPGPGRSADANETDRNTSL